jgi:hypothetical protein
VKVMIFAFKKFVFEIPAEIFRLGAVVMMAGLLTTAAVNSRADKTVAEINAPELRQPFIQPKDIAVAEARFTLVGKNSDTSEDKALEIASASPPPRRRPSDAGYYYELVRAQGDGTEGEYVLVERKCVPGVDMPQPCFLPKQGRQDFPMRRE